MATSALNLQDSVVTEIDIAAPPARVFAALTDVQQLKQWWISSICEEVVWKMDARDGGEWSFSTSPASKTINAVNQFKCRGKILEFQPPHRLVYSWVANWNDKPDAVTIVKWELTPTPGGTRLKVTHSGLAEQKVAREDYRGGWPGVLENLKKFVEKK